MGRLDRTRNDLTITPEGGDPIFLDLARSNQLAGTGFRAWARTNPERVTPRLQLPGVVQGSRTGEVGWHCTLNPANGWGDGRFIGGAWVAFTNNADIRFPGMAFPAPLVTAVALGVVPGAAPRVFYEHPANPTHVYLAAGRYVRRFDPADMAAGFTTEVDIGAGAAISQVALMDVGGTSYAWLATYSTSTGAPGSIFRHEYVVGTDTDTFTSNNATASALALGSTSNGGVMYRIYNTPTKIGTALAGTDLRDAANWGTTENIDTVFGPHTQRCRWLTFHDGAIYAAFPDGIYSFDEDLIFRNVAPQLAQFQDDENGIGMFRYGDLLIVPHLRGLYAIRGGAGQDISPVTGTTVRTDDDGRYFGLPSSGLVADDRWLYAPHYNGTDLYVFAIDLGGERIVSSTYLSRASTGPLTAGWVTGKTSRPRVFWADQSVLLYWDLPNADNPLQDPPGFASPALVTFAATDYGVPLVTGTFDRLMAEVEGVDANSTVEWSYRMAETGSWTTLGTQTANPTSFTPANPTGIVTQIRATIRRNPAAETTTPVIRSFFVSGSKRPVRAQGWQVTAILRNRLGRSQGVAELVAALMALEAGTTVLTCEHDTLGTITGLLDADVQIQEIAQAEDEEPVLLANFTLVDV